MSKLEVRLLEPALCHSFPGKPTCLAYDTEEKYIAIGCDNGKVCVLSKSGSGQVKVLSHVHPKPVKLMSFCHEKANDESLAAYVQKLQSDNIIQWLAYSVSNTLYFQLRRNYTVRNLKPSQEVRNNIMAGKVIDFKFLTQDIQFGAPELVVLTETELVLCAKSTSPTLPPIVTQSHKYPFIVSPVTCLQHCGLCTTAQSEMIVTGHADGSFRLWKCYFAKDPDKQNLSFEIAQVVYTALYFTFSREQLQKQMEAVMLIKMDRKQENLLIVNKCNRVLLFSYKKQGQAKAVSRPQSQEIILKDYENKSSPAVALETPSPQFSPPSTNPPLQLLQHFSCFYHKAQKNEKMDTVSVNCVEYSEEMGMLAVGTEKGLVVLDIFKNMLIQVVGSENKLIKICTEDTTKNKLANTSSKSCDVTCLEITNMILGEEPAAQLTLWVGTANGVIACLVIARDGEEPLQFRCTGIYRKKLQGGSVCGIHFHEINSDATVRNNVLVSTKDYNLSNSEHFPFIDDKTDATKKITGGIVKSGLFKFEGSPNPTHFVSLNKMGIQLSVQELLNHGLGEEGQTVPISKTSAALFFSSGGSHCVIKFADSRGPQLMYFQNN